MYSSKFFRVIHVMTLHISESYIPIHFATLSYMSYCHQKLSLIFFHLSSCCVQKPLENAPTTCSSFPSCFFWACCTGARQPWSCSLASPSSQRHPRPHVETRLRPVQTHEPNCSTHKLKEPPSVTTSACGLSETSLFLEILVTALAVKRTIGLQKTSGNNI